MGKKSDFADKGIYNILYGGSQNVSEVFEFTHFHNYYAMKQKPKLMRQNSKIRMLKRKAVK